MIIGLALFQQIVFLAITRYLVIPIMLLSQWLPAELNDELQG